MAWWQVYTWGGNTNGELGLGFVTTTTALECIAPGNIKMACESVGGALEAARSLLAFTRVPQPARPALHRSLPVSYRPGCAPSTPRRPRRRVSRLAARQVRASNQPCHRRALLVGSLPPSHACPSWEGLPSEVLATNQGCNPATKLAPGRRREHVSLAPRTCQPS